MKKFNETSIKKRAAMRKPSPIAVFALAAGLSAILYPHQAVRADDTPPALQRAGADVYRMLERLLEYDDAVPLDAHILERKTEEATVRERIVFRGVQGFFVPGILERPSEAGPHPCVLLLHGWSGSKSRWWQDGGYISGGNVRKGLLARGYAVLALDAQCHGDRIAENDYALVNKFEDSNEPGHERLFTQQDIYLQTVRDYRRALDYLESRDDIDASRIGIVGYSMGGTQTFMLTAVESRIKAAVACATPADTSKSSPLAPQNYCRGIGDRPFLMVVGRNDPMCSVEQAEQLHEMFRTDSSELRVFDGGHRISVEYVDPVVAWLADRL